jgi:hypothetical protein
MIESLRRKRLLGGEMLVERTVSKSGLLRDFGNTDAVDPSLAEQMAGGP